MSRYPARDSEWPASLNIDTLIKNGWKPSPFRQFVIKLHSRCDLACRYCYVYTMADGRWRSRPRVMSRETVDHVTDRIAEHVASHGLTAVDIVLHGGEPLLAGGELIQYVVGRIRAALGTAVRSHFAVQTNGLRLDRDFLRLFDALDVEVSVSVDGDRTAHDRNRRRPGGRGSHADVVRGVRLLSREPYRRLFGGLLCTVDLRNPPERTYEALLEFDPPVIDFLLPHGNWSAPPPRRDADSAETPYADWLIAIFDRWSEGLGHRTRIRLFEEILRTLVDGRSRVEGLGTGAVGFVVVETDGAIEQSDMLASAYEGAAATGLCVARDPFDSALLTPGIAARQIGVDALSPTCRSCDLRDQCGGGLYPHRYRAGEGFANPSVYCPDLYRLISHVRARLVTHLTSSGEPA
ncbi:FxsB family radical SAM/SPASM domain protein [Actinoallomurus purpureus]|uniref:FxsB family cyclophane-forming radical SAM/SPASM peptide maturase n=1 Tax=Actinoallomurus purpureus TaxID=478114 RepID=UPI002093C8C1|nr:FxsB family cyclophane-forming radical SAM/SPASM peptide maturase [Actinoallomurus purpureus]MCO6003633.1 FxsB family radical SAM/SPASM domain protein [Actinoallomurus purpureus]